MKLFVLRAPDIITRCVQYVAQLVVDAKHPLCVYIGPEARLRTRLQNDLLWAIYTEIADATGFGKDDLHEYFKRRLLGVEVKQVLGTRLETVRSSTQLSTVDFADFVEAIIAIVSEEQGIVIQMRPSRVVVE